jgi:hypothetical protein
MTSAQECQEALQKLTGRLSELSPEERDNYFGNRTISVTIPDLGVTFVTKLGSGDDPVREALPGEPPADIRLTAKSDEVLSLAQSPMNIGRSWVAGRVKIEASMKDLFRLRRLLLFSPWQQACSHGAHLSHEAYLLRASASPIPRATTAHSAPAPAAAV